MLKPFIPTLRTNFVKFLPNPNASSEIYCELGDLNHDLPIPLHPRPSRHHAVVAAASSSASASQAGSSAASVVPVTR